MRSSGMVSITVVRLVPVATQEDLQAVAIQDVTATTNGDCLVQERIPFVGELEQSLSLERIEHPGNRHSRSSNRIR
jgi:hypothetical protein